MIPPLRYRTPSVVSAPFLVLVTCAFLIASCDSVELVRDHERDPSGTDFRPEPPAGFNATDTGFSVMLSWEDLSEFEQGYLIERSFDGRDFEEVVRLPPNSVRYDDTLRIPYFEATYRLSAFADRGEEVMADSTLEAYIKIAEPAPYFYPGLVSEREIRLEWSSPGTEGLSLEIERGSSSQSYELLAVVDNDQKLFRDVFDIEAGTTYTYRVRGRAGDWSVATHRSEIFSVRLEPPEWIYVTPEADHVHLTWTRHQVHRGWTVERCIEPGNECVTTDIDISQFNTGSGGSFKDYDVDSAYHYRYRVKSLLSDYSPSVVVGNQSRITPRRILNASTDKYFDDIDRAGENILLGSFGTNVEVINPLNRQVSCSFDVFYREGAISGDGRRIAVLGLYENSLDMFVQFYDCERGREIGIRYDAPAAEPGAVPRMSMNESGTRAYIGFHDGIIAYDHQDGLVWSTRGGNTLSFVAGIADPLDAYVVEAGPSALRIRASADGAILWTLPVWCRGVTRSSISPDGSLLACPMESGATNIHSLENGEILASLPYYGFPWAVGFSSDGHRLAVLDSDIRIWNWRTGTILARIPGDFRDLEDWWISLPYSEASDGFLLTSPRSVYSLAEVGSAWDAINADR